jgi:hydrogenase maturation protease
MTIERIKAIADAVLYEGYILYPYRPSAIKNRQRWTFGNVFPQAFGSGCGDTSLMQTQVLLQGGPETTLDVHVRFLQVQVREVGKLVQPAKVLPESGEPETVRVPSLAVGGTQLHGWEEAVERQFDLNGLWVGELAIQPCRWPVTLDGARSIEPIAGDDGDIAAALIRTTHPLRGEIAVAAEQLDRGLFRLSVRIENLTVLAAPERADRNLAQRCAFASTHTILQVGGGALVSLLDPPAELRQAIAQCDNRATWPVLAGTEGDRTAMLSSPIILYDYPKIAPQSPGDLFDGTEIDEILTLRILAMTDAEKAEMAAVDQRARAVLERTHGLTAEQMSGLHGSMLSGPRTGDGAVPLAPGTAASQPRLASLLAHGRNLCVGAEVRLRPKPRGDILDLALKDQIAVIEAIERDFEDRIHVAVTLLDDPGRDLGVAGFPGHRFYFGQDEIELLEAGSLP